MLWFYVQKQGCRSSRAEFNRAFLDQRFQQATAPVRSFVPGADGRYAEGGHTGQWPVPALPADPVACAVHAACNGITPMQDILGKLETEWSELDCSDAGIARLR
jgi:hypothetical protein